MFIQLIFEYWLFVNSLLGIGHTGEDKVSPTKRLQSSQRKWMESSQPLHLSKRHATVEIVPGGVGAYGAPNSGSWG